MGASAGSDASPSPGEERAPRSRPRPPGSGGSGSAQAAGDRGQLLLVLAIVLASVLVALALVLNAAVFTESLATRGGDGPTDVARSMEGSTAAVADAYDATNDAAEPTVPEALAVFVLAIDDLETARREAAARNGAAYELTRTPHMGWWLRQASDRSFTPDDDADATDWTVLTAALDVGTMRLNVTRSDLYDGTSGVGTIDDEAFTVAISDAGETVNAYVFRDPANASVVVHVGDPGSFGNVSELLSSPDSCSATTDRAVIDFRAATLNGSACPALAFDDDLSGPIQLRFENVRASTGGDARVVGTYELVANGSVAVATNATGHPERFAPPSGGPPTAQAVVYSVDYESTYRLADVTHRRDDRYLPRREAY